MQGGAYFGKTARLLLQSDEVFVEADAVRLEQILSNLRPSVAQEVRRTPDLAGVALVALSGYGRDSDKARSLECGFDAHLSKPAAPEDLARAIAKHCSQRQSDRSSP